MSSAPPLGLVDRLVANAVLETTVDQAHIPDKFFKYSSCNFQSTKQFNFLPSHSLKRIYSVVEPNFEHALNNITNTFQLAIVGGTLPSSIVTTAASDPADGMGTEQCLCPIRI